MTAPLNVVTRSPGGLHLSTLAGGGSSALGRSGSGDATDLMARSPSAISTASESSQYFPRRPGQPPRRPSSVGLDYYWSSAAGNGPSSSTSSLASSHASPTSPYQLLHAQMRSKSHMSLKELIEQEAAASAAQGMAAGQGAGAMGDVPQPRPPLYSHWSDSTDPGPSNRRIHIVSYPSSSSGNLPMASPVGGLGMDDEPSPVSTSSKYSDSERGIDSLRMNTLDTTSGHSGHSPIDTKLDFSRSWSQDGIPVTSSPIDGPDNNHDPDHVRASMTSEATFREGSQDLTAAQHELLMRTPVAPVWPDNPSAPGYPASGRTRHDRQPAEDHSPITPGVDTTPTRAVQPRELQTLPGGGRLAFVAPPDVSRKSIVALEREVEASDNKDKMRIQVEGRDEVPQSAPAWQGEFGIRTEPEGEETIKKRNKRTTMPALPASSSSSLADSLMSTTTPPQSDSPEKPSESRSRAGSRDSRTGLQSPEIPMRSSLRGQANPKPPVGASPLSVSDPKTVPLIINTASSPAPSPPRPSAGPRRPSRSPDRVQSPELPKSNTISDLTDMLGGAIDAIGLIDSRDTPPPNVFEPPKDRPVPSTNVSSASLAPPAPVDIDLASLSSASTTSIPLRGATWSDSGSQASLPISTRRSTHPLQILKTPSMLSMRSAAKLNAADLASSPPGTISMQRPWPGAMLYGNIKGLKTAGDRAKGYAKAINELSRADTGLRVWIEGSLAQANRQPMRLSSKAATHAGLGIRSLSISAPLHPSDPNNMLQPHPREVSSGSEFPMRADATTAREISSRLMDPNDQPTALPANLPYPQLQQQYQYQYGGGMKSSMSMTSVASAASSKKGFLAAFGRMGKKDSTAPGLGPPSGGAAKKDVRGLPISAPSSGPGGPKQSDSPQRDAFSGGTRMQQSMTTPMGPRGPRGSYTPPPGMTMDRSIMEANTIQGPRGSLDTGLSRMSPTMRGSVDMGRNAKTSMPARSSPMALSAMTVGGPTDPAREAELRAMADVLPHVERQVLRGYLMRYGEQMGAISAYLEDEQRGAVMRA